MRNATTFMVGMLMIAMLGALVVPAQAPVYYDEDEWRSAPGDEGPPIGEERYARCDPGFKDGEWLVVGSNGGLHTDCGGECPDVPKLDNQTVPIQ